MASGNLKTGFFSRFKRNEAVDRVEEAWKSQDLKKMLRARNWKPKTPLSRHFLLLFIVMRTFEQRENSMENRTICEETAWVHIDEFEIYKPLLEKQFGRLPNVHTFQYLTTLLEEQARYDEAIGVCLKAIALNVPTGQDEPYKSRIKQLEQAKLVLIN